MNTTQNKMIDNTRKHRIKHLKKELIICIENVQFSYKKLTETPPEGWCIIIRALGKECRIPGAPAANKRLAIEHA